MSEFKETAQVEEQDITTEQQDSVEEVVAEDVNAEETTVEQSEDNNAQLIEELQAKVLRVQADYDNFRRRTVKEKEELAKYASMKLIEQLLPTVDNFDRALEASAATKDYDSFAKGVDMIFRSLLQVLENEGLKVMEPVGQPFNPEYHQAVMTVESDEYEEGVVVEQLQKGYVLKDKVIRPAMVKVSS